MSCSTKKMDSYAAYLILENLSNIGDISVIHVRFKVVSKQSAHFSVVADGKGKNKHE